MSPRNDKPKVPADIEQVIRALITVDKAASLYPRTSTIPRETATACANVLGQALRERSEIRFVVSKEGLVFEGATVLPEQPACNAFAMMCYNHRLADIRFHVGVDARSILGLLSLLQKTPQDIATAGGFEMRMWDLNIGNITVTEVHVSIVDSGQAGDEPAESFGDLTRAQIDEIILGAYGGRPRDRLTVTRFLADPSSVSDYLSDVYGAGGGTESGLPAAGERFAELAEVAYGATIGEKRMDALRSLGQALAELGPELRHSMLVDEVLPEARTNEALAAVIRQLDLDEVCRMLVADVNADEVSRDGMARAIKNLSMISLSDHNEVINAAGAAMRGARLGESFVSDVVESALPSRIVVREPPRAAQPDSQPVEAIFKMMDLAPVPEGVLAEDREVRELQREAKRGITDGDVIMSLVSLVGLDAREAQFATTMSMLEDSLGVLVERGEIDVAADAADALILAAGDESLDPGQRSRLRGAIKRFTRPSDVQAIAHALRVYPPGSREHAAARRLLEVLGPLAIDPLFEQLAAEEDMGVRKLIVDLLSDVALKYISELGKHVSDQRWFAVRNVVSILGSTRSSAVLPYVEKVVRHPEPRVRREVIRALSQIHDRLAHDLLITSLGDDDAQNVQLAARYLGNAGIKPAIPALAQVAKGEGRGNREIGPRVEAVEALGRLKAVQALPVLESLVRGRSILGSARGREVRTAAEAAILQIRAVDGGAS